MVTATATEGGGTVAVNLAAALARTRGGTVLICADQHGVIPRLLGPADGRGFAELLAGTATLADVAMPTAEVPGLEVITPGLDAAGAVYDMQYDKVQRVMRDLRREVRYVVIDVPSPVIAADTFSLAEFADAAILTLQAGTAQVADINDCLERLERLRTAVLAAVLLPSASKTGRGGGRRSQAFVDEPYDRTPIAREPVAPEPVSRVPYTYSSQVPAPQAQARQPEPRRADVRYPEPLYTDPFYSEPRPSEPRLSEPRFSEARHSEARPSEARHSESRQPESRPAESRPAEGRPTPSFTPHPRVQPVTRDESSTPTSSKPVVSQPVLRPVAGRRASAQGGSNGGGSRSAVPGHAEDGGLPANLNFSSAWQPRNVSETWPLPASGSTDEDEEPGLTDPPSGNLYGRHDRP